MAVKRRWLKRIIDDSTDTEVVLPWTRDAQRPAPRERREAPTGLTLVASA